MKKLIWILVIIAAVIGGLAYWDKDFRNIILESSGQKPVKSTVYKWRDKNGKWQISSTPPPAGITYTEQEYLHNTNVIPALPASE